MKVSISKKNNKMGKVPNISLPPVKTCRPEAPCIKACYANKHCYGRWPNVKEAWDRNLYIYQHKGSVEYFRQVYQWVEKHSPEYFRWHVGGDCIDKTYCFNVIRTAEKLPETKFMLFTKRWDLWPFNIPLPENLSVILSMWPEAINPEDYEFPRAWLSHDPRLPDYYFKCPGQCDSCYKCWNIVKLGYDVVFDLH